MFELTDTDTAPWTVVKSNDKKRPASTQCGTSSVSSTTTTKDHEVVGVADPRIVGRALSD